MQKNLYSENFKALMKKKTKSKQTKTLEDGVFILVD